MKKSDDISQLVTALAEAQSEMGSASYDSVNPHFKSRYSTLNSVWEACRGPLSKHGLAVIQPASTEGGNFVVETMLLHKSGQWISSEIKLLLDKNNMQGLGSAISYARRYTLASLLGITSDEDDDGNAASAPPAKKQKTEPSSARETLIVEVRDAASKVRIDPHALTSLIETRFGKTAKELSNQELEALKEMLSQRVPEYQ